MGFKNGPDEGVINIAECDNDSERSGHGDD
jgi:hypothetical protein